MSVKLDKNLEDIGTKFKLFPQPRFLRAFREPETVRVSVPAGKVQPGPADDRAYVVDAINKRPYRDFDGPPYIGERHPPILPGPDGHFDHLDVDSREFACATMYATVRRVLDIWEDYFGRRIEWHFSGSFDRLELIPLIDWDNAQSGFGFLEFGFGRTVIGTIDHTRPYAENFDVLAHELGHSIIFAEVGVPEHPADEAIDYGGMHESSGDLVAIVSALHFDKVIDVLLDSSHGNLFTVNELDRLGELSESREIRVAFNSVRLSEVGDEPHDRSVPVTGGIFDVMVEVYQKGLVAHGLITQDLATRSTQGPGGSSDFGRIAREFQEAYTGNEKAFRQELLIARDYVGTLLAETWQTLSPNFFTYHQYLTRLLRADLKLGGRNQQTIRECFAWREIAPPDSLVTASFRKLRDCGLGPKVPPAALAKVDEATRRRPVGLPTPR